MSGLASLIRYLSIRHVAAAPVRSLLTLFGVALGVAMVVGMTSVNDAILASFREMVDRAGGKSDLEVTGDESGVSQDLVADLADRPEVAHVTGVLEKTTLLGREGEPLGKGERVLVIGVDLLGDLELLPFERDGAQKAEGGFASGEMLVADPLAFLNDPHAILLTETLAAKLGVTKGSIVRMRTTEKVESFRVEGVVKETSKAKAFGGLVAIMSIDAAQLAFGASGRVDRIDLALAKGIDAKTGAERLQPLIAGRAEIGPPARRGEQTSKMVQSLQVGLQLSAGIAMMVGMFLIYNTISVAVTQRRRDLGILRAIGVTRRRLVVTVIAEALVLSVLGGAIGVLLGWLLARGLIRQVSPAVSRFYQPIVPPPVRVSPTLALVGMGLGVLATLFAAYLPARRAARMSPVDALRRDLIATGKEPVAYVRLAIFGALLALLAPFVFDWTLRRPGVPAVIPGYMQMITLVAGAACAMPSILVVSHRLLAGPVQRLFGIPARLGIDNVVRALGRSATTCAALMLATSASLAVAGYAHSFRRTSLEWIEQSVPGEVFVTAGSPLIDRLSLPFDARVTQKLEDPPIPGVVAIDTARNIRVSVLGRRIPLFSTDSAHYFATIQRFAGFRRVAEGDPDLRSDDLTREPAILVAQNFARALGLHPGMSIELPTPSGARSFRIRAVVVDYSDEQGWAMIDQRWYREYWHDERIDVIKLYLPLTESGEAAPLAEAERVAQEVRRRLATSADTASADDALFVITSAALKDEIRRTIDDTFAIGDASQLIAFVVAILGVIGTMLAAVLDRTREIGVLRALGATRRQVLQAIVAEAGFLGLVSALVGVAVGIPAALVFTRVIGVAATGWDVPFSFPASAAIRIGLAIVLVAALSGLVPGQRAAKLKITKALAYE